MYMYLNFDNLKLNCLFVISKRCLSLCFWVKINNKYISAHNTYNSNHLSLLRAYQNIVINLIDSIIRWASAPPDLVFGIVKIIFPTLSSLWTNDFWLPDGGRLFPSVYLDLIFGIWLIVNCQLPTANCQ